jgi:drug/metabolite transporter (DMT)-like permease
MTVNKPLLGIAFMVMSCALLATKDGMVKTFLDQVGPAQIIWIQYVGTFLTMSLVAAPRYGWRVLKPEPLGGQFFRGAVSAGAVATLYWALTYIPLAEATAMFMLSPVVVALISPFVLGERIDNARRAAIAVGFIGVLVILKPGFGGSATGYLIGILAGFLMAFYFIANRKLAATSPPLINVAHNALMGAVAFTPFLPLFWQTPSMDVMPKLVALVALAVVGQGLMIASFSYAPASVVAPYTYAMLVFAAIIGYLVFDNFPDLASWIGIALIVGAGLYIAQRERRAAA